MSLNRVVLDKVVEQDVEVPFQGSAIKLRRINFEDLAAVSAEIRKQRLEAIAAFVAKEQRQTLVANSLAKTVAQDPSEDDIWNFVYTSTGQAFLLCRSLKTNYPNTTISDCSELVEHTDLATILYVESGLLKVKEGETTPENPPTSQLTGQK